jgi:hypothetical protein
MIHTHVKGVRTEGFYKQFESLCDGILDFKTEEREGQIEQLVRVRLIRRKSHWRKLKVLNTGEVELG